MKIIIGHDMFRDALIQPAESQATSLTNRKVSLEDMQDMNILWNGAMAKQIVSKSDLWICWNLPTQTNPQTLQNSWKNLRPGGNWVKSWWYLVGPSVQKLKEAQILPVGCYTFLKTLGCTLKVLILFRKCNDALLEPNVFQLKVYRLLGAFELGHLTTMTVHGVRVGG